LELRLHGWASAAKSICGTCPAPLQSIFFNAATHFGLMVSLKEAEAMHQSVDRVTCTPPVFMAGEITLPSVEKFCNLDSILSADAHFDDDISSRFAKASYSFGWHYRRLWDGHGIRLD
jgi:hypothetical protein